MGYKKGKKFSKALTTFTTLNLREKTERDRK